MGVGGVPGEGGRGGSLPDLIELNRGEFFGLADLALAGGEPTEVSDGGDKDYFRRPSMAAGYGHVSPVTAEWVSPAVIIRDREMAGENPTLSAVAVLLERGASREALLGFFATNILPGSEQTTFGNSAVINPRLQVGSWLRTYVVDGFVACGREDGSQDSTQDELNALARSMFSGLYLRLAYDRIIGIRNEMSNCVEPTIPDSLKRVRSGDRIG